MTGLGVSASAVPFLTKDALAELTDTPDEEVPRLSRLRIRDPETVTPSGERPPEREPVFYTIPRDEWEYTEGVFDAARRIERTVENLDPNGLLDVSVTTTVDGGRTKKAIRVNYVNVIQTIRRFEDSNVRTADELPDDPEGEIVEKEHAPAVDLETVREALPATASGRAGGDRDGATLEGVPVNAPEIEDIPVFVEETTRVEEAYYDREYRPILGGCQMRQSRWLGSHCTLGTPAYDKSNNQYVMVTSGHCLDGNEGDAMFQPGGWGTSFGYPEDWVYEQGRNDAGTVTTERIDEEIGYEIASDYGNYGSYPIRGTMCYDEIKDRIGDKSWTVHKQGRTTGRDTGYLTAASPSRDLGRFEVNQEVESDGGDSGGPYYKVYGGGGSYAYIIGIHNWGNRDNDDKGPAGNLMCNIEQYFNIEVNY